MKNIKFVSELSYSGDYRSLEYGYKSIATDKSKRYRSVLSRLLKLHKAAHDLLNYLVDFMDDDNVVYSNGQFKERFKNLVWASMKEDLISEGMSHEEAAKVANKKKYSDVTVRKAYATLVKHDLLIRFKDNKGREVRGCYWVNPEFFWRDTEKSRDEKIRKILQIEAGTEHIIIKSRENL